MRTQILLERVAVRMLELTRAKLDGGLALEDVGALVLEDEVGHVAFLVVDNRGVVLRELSKMTPPAPAHVIATFQEPSRPGHLLVATQSLSDGWLTHWIPLLLPRAVTHRPRVSSGGAG
jgi:hypothetical protein